MIKESYDMRCISKRLIFIICFIFFASQNTLSSAHERYSAIRTFGDIMQIANPIIGAYIVYEKADDSLLRYVVIYAENLSIMYGIKVITSKSKANFSKRPTIAGKHTRYDGMPSAHTASAWFPASYIRVFHEDNKKLAIPFYFIGAITGYSRIHSKEHTVAQVIAGAFITEAVVYINSKFNWSKNLKAGIDIRKHEYAVNLQFTF